jgi:hypothetical protein
LRHESIEQCAALRFFQYIRQPRIRQPDQLEKEKCGIFHRGIESGSNGLCTLRIGDADKVLVQGLQGQPFERGIRQEARFDAHDHAGRNL